MVSYKALNTIKKGISRYDGNTFRQAHTCNAGTILKSTFSKRSQADRQIIGVILICFFQGQSVTFIKRIDTYTGYIIVEAYGMK